MAGRFSVEAVFKAVDRVTAPISRMQNRVGKFTRAMTRGLRRANRMVGRLVGGMARGVKTVAKFGGAAIALGGAAVIGGMNRAADAADRLAKQSRRLQFPIEELQEWKFIAEQSGVSTELLDNSLGAFSKRLGEAAGGTGPLVTGLKNINPELLKQLQNTDSISDAFGLYINAMRDADSATEKAALANAAFSRAGLNLVNIADNSAEAIKGLRKEQRENGNITMEQAVAAEAYNDAVASLKKSLTGLIQQVLLPMAPAITKNLRQWREWIVANKDLIRTKITEFAKNLWSRIKALTSAVIEFNDKYDIANMLGEGLDMLGKFARFLERNGGLILKVVAGVVALSAVLQTLTVVMGAVNLVMAANPITWIVLGIVALIAAIAAAIIYWDDIKAAIVGFGEAIMDSAAPAIQWLEDAAGTVTAAWDGVGEFIEKILGKARAGFDKISEITSGVAGFFGMGDDEEAPIVRGGPGAMQMVSPQERVARSVEESRSTSTSEVTIRDETGRAQVTGGKMGPGLKLQTSGAM